MQNLNLDDTITAVATALGESGIGIVRISGKDALAIADKVFVSRDNRKPSGFPTYTTHHGWICEGSGKIIDEVILTVMRGPRSYTKEDVVEINCHGGMVATRAVLDLILAGGARLAEPGEFTKRAFLNGRIDLAQAEAVLDVIKAKTDSALRMSAQQLKGVLSKEINALRKELVEVLADLEAHIDFPEDDLGAFDFKDAQERLVKINAGLSRLISSSCQGRVLREGVRAVICGRPNVGKSSLLNALLKEERSIVTPVAGTTRDTIEEIIDIRGIPVRIIDTAGIIEPRDLVEKEAVARSRRYIAAADAALLLFDASKKLGKEDYALMRKLAKKNTIAVINKIDLKVIIERNKISRFFKRIVSISAKKARHIDTLEEQIVSAVAGSRVMGSESCLVSNRRHIEALRRAQKLVAQAQDCVDNKLSAEFIAQDVKEALGFLDKILGKSFSDDVLDKIFSEFCIGK